MSFGVTPQGLDRLEKLKRAFGITTPGGFHKPAKDMSPQEARDALVYLDITWELHIKELSISDDMKVIAPKANASTRVTIAPNIISGICFLLENGKDFPLYPVTLQFAVVLWRLASQLKADYGPIQAIYSGGIGIGDDKKSRDCHHEGRCIDFFGADTAKGSFRVERDWGNQQFIRPDRVKTNNWAEYRGHKFYYRLEHPAEPSVNQPAKEFFRWVYEFAQRECRDVDSGPASTIGDRSYIMHPDHPDPKRESHRNHIHFQIGST